MVLNLIPTRDALQGLEFQQIYIQLLGWSVPRDSKPFTLIVPGEVEHYVLVPIAEMSNVFIFEVSTQSKAGKIPNVRSRKKVALELRKRFREHMLIFLDGQRTQSLWYWLKREGQHDTPKEHSYMKGQPGDLALGKLQAMAFELADLEKHTPSVLEVANKIKDALDVEQVTKRFYMEFKELRDEFAKYIANIDDERDQSWYVSVLLNRLMFIYFLQRKFFLDNGNADYLQDKMAEVKYTDLGAKQLREMLFNSTRVTGLFGFENRKNIFEGVDSRFKFVVLTYRKGEHTDDFPTAFMRHEVSELDSFPQPDSQRIAVDLIRQLSPDSLSIMEFKGEIDVTISQKMQNFPLLNEKLSGTWNLVLTNEFHMTNAHYLFKMEPGPGRLPLYEGKMIHQFTHILRPPRYWVNEQEGRTAILGKKTADNGQKLEYQRYRLGFRDIARNTDQRTLISTIIPPAFHGNKIPTVALFNEMGNELINDQQQLFLCAVWNSFVVDWLLRLKVTATLNFFHIYQVPVPRLTAQDLVFRLIGQRTARLICTTPEFAALWEEIFPSQNWTSGVAATDPAERASLRAEIDGLVAHLYELSEDEFAYVLSTFPLVEQRIKDATLQAYRDFAISRDDLALLEAISQGESQTLEFKLAACWNAHKGQKDDGMRKNILEEVAAFLTSREGGKVLIGVDDDGTIVGLEEDYRAANPQKQNRDGYELYLLEHIKNFLQGNWSLCYKIVFTTLRGKDICCIDIQPASSPVYTALGAFYIREGSRKRALSAQETMDYSKQRWP